MLPSDASEREKSVAIAKLMKWKTYTLHHVTRIRTEEGNSIFDARVLCPYKDSVNGLAQFAAILLKFPEVIARFCTSVAIHGKIHHMQMTWPQLAKMREGIEDITKHPFYIEFTQANFLDELLRTKGLMEKDNAD